MTRVGVIGPRGADLFADNIIDCLPDLGVTAVGLGTPRPAIKNPRLAAAQAMVAHGMPRLDERWQRRIGERAVDENCDVVISVLGDLMPAAIEVMKVAGIRVVLWFPDAVSNLGRQMMFMAPYTRLYFKDREVVDRLSSITGAPVAYLPEACNPHWHHSDVEPGTNPHLVLAGHIYASRAALLRRMVDDEIPLELYGSAPARWYPEDEPWKSAHQGRWISGREKADIFRSAAGVLNNLHPAELTSVNCRLFEAAGSGAAVLCEYRDALPDLFEPGAEILPFNDYSELLKHSRALLEDPELTRRIGDAAAARALAEHTYQIRLAQILEDVL